MAPGHLSLSKNEADLPVERNMADIGCGLLAAVKGIKTQTPITALSSDSGPPEVSVRWKDTLSSVSWKEVGM